MKLGLALLLLWLVLANYPETVVAVFLGAFVATMLIFSMAFFVREYLRIPAWHLGPISSPGPQG